MVFASPISTENVRGQALPHDIPGIKDTAELMLSVYQSAREHKVVEL